MTALIENQSVSSNIPAHFDDRSRLWFYVANRDLTEIETNFVDQKLATFLPNWTAHNNHLKTHGDVLFKRVLMIVVDETQAGVSGCGIDKSVHFVENLGNQMGIDFFDRMIIGFKNEHGGVGFLPINEFSAQIKSGILPKETLVADTLVNTKLDFDTAFLKPIESTWIKRFI